MSNCEQANHLLQPQQQQELIRLMTQHFNQQLQPPQPPPLPPPQPQPPQPASDPQMPLSNFQSALAHYQRQQQYQRLCQDAINFSAQTRGATGGLSQPAQNLLAAGQHQQQQVAGQLASMNAFGLLNPLMAAAAGPQHIFNALNCFGLTQSAESNQALALNLLQQQYLLQMASAGGGNQANVMNEMTSNQGAAREPALKFGINTILGRDSPSLTPPSENHAQLGLQSVAAGSKFMEANHKSSAGHINNTGTISPRPNNNAASNKRHGREPRSNYEKTRHEESARKNSNQQQLRQPLVSPSSARTNANASSNEIDATGGTALSSLTNFVSNSLAPIFGDSDLSAKSRRSPSVLAHNQRSSGLGRKAVAATGGHYFDLNGSNEFSGNESSHEDDRSSLASSVRVSRSNGTSKQTSSSSSSSNPISDNPLKSSPSATVASTINTTLAKAPLELVQKQPAWVFCTRYSDRPSSGPRTRRAKSRDKKPKDTKLSADEKRPRTAFTSEQLEKLREEFQANSYLDEKRRKSLAERLNLNENQIKIWFQNKRAKMKKQSNQPNPLRGLLVAGGLYNHSTATSDCSESYANGLADDIGNRIMRDVELENSDCDDEGGRSNHQVGAGEMDDVDRLLFKQQNANKPLAGAVAAQAEDRDNNKTNNNNKSGNAQEQATGDRGATLKRDHQSSNQSDGDDEDDDNMAHSNSSPSRPGTKRAKLNHTSNQHNHQHQHHNQHHQADRLAISHANLSRLIDCAGSGEQLARVATSAAAVDEDEEPVISVS